MKIQMVDLQTQYAKIEETINQEILDCIKSSSFVRGPKVKAFESSLSDYLNVKHVISCGNGTDALQIALMAIDLQPGDEVIVPAFTYIAAVEVIALLRGKVVVVDVDKDTFNTNWNYIQEAITPKTKAILPVHLFGQSVDLEPIKKNMPEGVFLIEDNAQSIGADYQFENGTTQKVGTIGHIGCTSFYPSKTLGAFGDGGAMMSNDDDLAARLRRIANHGQNVKYYHSEVGVNSRLDGIQAAILNVKLKHLNDYINRRKQAAHKYDELLKDVHHIQIPKRVKNSTHVFHQYTLKVKNGKRDRLKNFLKEKGIPSMIYYPVPVQQQAAYSESVRCVGELNNTKELCNSVLSLPMHSEMSDEQIMFICDAIKSFFK